MKDYSLKPYKVCKGRRFYGRPFGIRVRRLPTKQRKYLVRIYKPLCIRSKANMCNDIFTEKNKIRFISQLLRWFSKDPTGYRIKAYDKDKLREGSIINVGCRTYKAAWKKLLSRLDYTLKDYKRIRQRKKFYLYFTFFFTNLNLNEKSITVDINTKKNGIFNIFITLNSYFIKDFEVIRENGIARSTWW